MSMPRVSIIIPVKNEERNIGCCLNAVANIDYPGELYEIIIVDNNSTDTTLELAGNCASQHKKIRIVQSSSTTIAGVRMDGFDVSKGDIVAFLDGDCIPPAQWLKQGVKILNRNHEISCAGFSACPPDETAPWVEGAWHLISSGSRWRGTQAVTWLSSFNLMIKREYFEKVGGFDRSLETCEDADLGLKLNEISTLIYSDDIHIRHLGNVKTLYGFFMKELWRGKSNLNHFFKTREKHATILSVFVPPAYLLIFMSCLVISLAAIAYDISTTGILMLWAIVIGLPLMLSVRKKVSGIGAIAKTSILYGVYLVARGVAIVSK